MFCIKCGNGLKNGESFCIKCGTRTNEIEDTRNDEIEIKKDSKLSKCKFCGNTMLEDEKFCIKCGKTKEGQMACNDLNSYSLKKEIQNVFVNNKLLSIVSKFAIVFALYYPIVLILTNLELATDLIEILDNINTIMFYGYYVALISLYANKKYIPLILAILLRATNSIVHICQNGFGASSIERIAIIIFVLFYILKEFKHTQEYKKIENKYKEIKDNLKTETQLKICPNCGEKVSVNSTFCPNCGNKM